MADRGRETTRGATLLAHRERNQRLARLARRQHSVVGLRQLTDLGLSATGIRSRVRRGALHRVRRGVFAAQPPPYDKTQLRLAAVLVCGDGAAICGPTAADHLDVGDLAPPVIHVRSPRRTGRGHAGIAIHRGSIDPRDLRIVDSVPCTSADLVLIDLAPQLDEAALEVVLVAAESKGLIKRRRLGELIGERRGLPGIPKLERLLALEPAIVRSGLELLMLPIARMAGVERPLANHPIAVPTRPEPLIVDCAWPELRMVVEADSQRFHGDWERAAADRERDQLLALAGWRCHRFVRGRLAEDPDGSAERLRGLAAARRVEVDASRPWSAGSARGGR